MAQSSRQDAMVQENYLYVLTKPRDGSGEEIKYGKIPVAALNVTCRMKLSYGLNQDLTLPAPDGGLRNWQGLCERLGFSYQFSKLASVKNNPTMFLLDAWEQKQGATILVLIRHLENMERFDILDDVATLIRRDCLAYLDNEEQERRIFEQYARPVQDTNVGSSTQSGSSTAMGQALTVDDVNVLTQSGATQNGPNGMGPVFIKYDAYVSYAESDAEFIPKILDKLERERGLKLFIKDRDMLAGVPEVDTDLKMINERCERILLIVSPDFIENPRCEFRTLFAQALAVDNSIDERKVIPVIYKPCTLPARLRYLARLDYSRKSTFGHDTFWTRLYASIRQPLDAPHTMSSTISRCVTPPMCLLEMEGSPRAAPEAQLNYHQPQMNPTLGDTNGRTAGPLESNAIASAARDGMNEDDYRREFMLSMEHNAHAATSSGSTTQTSKSSGIFDRFKKKK